MKESIKKYQFKEGLKLEFEILNLHGVFQSKNNIMTVPHRAQFYHILYIKKGIGTHFVDFNPVTIEDNTILFIPHNCVNKFDKEGSYKGKGILFTDSFFCKNQQDIRFLRSSMLFSDLYSITKIKVDSESSDLSVFLTLMETEYEKSPDAAQYSILHNMLHVFLLQAEREMNKQGFQEMKPSANLDYLVLFKDFFELVFLMDSFISAIVKLRLFPFNY